MENTKSQQAFNPFAAFPAQDRTKIEIIEAWLRASNAWSKAALDPNNTVKLSEGFYALMQWYILVHGYTKARKNANLENLREKLKLIPEVASGKKLITQVMGINELSDYQLFASEYMYAVGITDILQYHRPDEQYLVIGMAER